MAPDRSGSRALIPEEESDDDDDRIFAHVRIKAQRRGAWTGVSVRGVV